MAGDWLKFEVDTPEKQEVFDITVAMGWSDPDLTVGKLLKVWRWFDKHTIDGNAPRVTLALLDSVSGVSGFAQAMANVGWLVCEGAGVSLSNFGRHNGKTAKDRCLTARRVAKHKTNGQGNAASNDAGVSGALPREDSREELDKKEPNTKAEAKHPAATRLPADWIPTDGDVEFCKTERQDLNVTEVANRFRDYWVSQPGAKGRKLDWNATWRNWVRNERRVHGAGPPPGTGYQTATDKAKNFADRLTGRSNERATNIIDINEPPA